MRYRTLEPSMFMDVRHEQIWEPLHDSEPYPVSGYGVDSMRVNFFTVPMGQCGKTELDTNMYLSGMLPRPNRFFVTAVEIVFLPNVELSQKKRIADINAAARSGVVTFQLQNRRYMYTAPLAACPATSYWHEDMKDEAGKENIRAHVRAQLSEQMRDTDYGAFGGRPFKMVPTLIESTQSFMVTVRQLAPLPSGMPARLLCRLPGYLIRGIQ